LVHQRGGGSGVGIQEGALSTLRHPTPRGLAAHVWMEGEKGVEEVTDEDDEAATRSIRIGRQLPVAPTIFSTIF